MPVYGSHLLDYAGLKVGHRIRERRQRLGLTLSDLAGSVGLSTARLSQIENEQHVVDLDQTFAIASRLELPRTTFLPEDIRYPYQVSRSGDLVSRPPHAVELAQPDRDETVRHHNAFWPLADRFVGRCVEPMLGHIGPVRDQDLRFYYHDDEEFVFGLKGTIEFLIKTPRGIEHELIHRGDCLCFRSSYPHCLRSLEPDGAESLHAIASTAGAIQTAFDSISLRPIAYIEDPDGDQGGATRIGEHLKKCRDALGWSSEKVAAIAGISESRLLQLERGRRSIRLDVMLKLARLYGRPLWEFTGPPSEMRDPHYVIHRSADVRLLPTRKRRMPVERPNASVACTFQPLASGFSSRGMYPYLVRIPNEEMDEVSLHEHHGHEFIYVLEGELELTTFAEERQVSEILRAGDSCYLDSSVPHVVRGRTRNPFAETSAQVIDLFWCPLGERYLFEDADASS
jgi:transcriptional regulator with XRE-family HTH domain